jgi:ribosomal-protein-alanine N-acetyltransferase
VTINYKIIERVSAQNAETLFRLRDLDQKYFPQPWDDLSWANLFSTNAERFAVVLEVENDLVGFSLLEISFVDSFAHLLKIIIDPEKRQSGLGHSLLQESITILQERGIKSFFLEVEEKNLAAIKLYERAGFKIIHKKKQFYSNGSNAIIMTLET